MEGAPTGNPEVPPVANILVKYIIDEKILKVPVVNNKEPAGFKISFFG